MRRSRASRPGKSGEDISRCRENAVLQRSTNRDAMLIGLANERVERFVQRLRHQPERASRLLVVSDDREVELCESGRVRASRIDQTTGQAVVEQTPAGLTPRRMGNRCAPIQV